MKNLKNRTSSHVFILVLTVGLTAVAHYSIYYGGLIRGYETSSLAAYRNIGVLACLAILPIFIKKFGNYSGNWTLYTSAVLLFSVGLTVQYRLFSDPEYTSRRDKAEARQAKIRTAQLHYIQENYTAEKKQLMGLPATPPSPVDLSEETPRPAEDSWYSVLVSGRTVNPILGVIGLIFVFFLLRNDRVLEFLQNNGFLIVLLTLGPLFLAAITSRAGKSIGNMTPWEPSKIPFLIGFAAILSVLYKNLARTYWGLPRAKDVVPLVFMAALPFVPFFVLKDFGQMMVFSSVYATLTGASVGGERAGSLRLPRGGAIRPKALPPTPTMRDVPRPSDTFGVQLDAVLTTFGQFPMTIWPNVVFHDAQCTGVVHNRRHDNTTNLGRRRQPDAGNRRVRR